jgi:hypothetical protein
MTTRAQMDAAADALRGGCAGSGGDGESLMDISAIEGEED